MINEKLENNVHPIRKPVRYIKDKNQYDRFRDRKNKKIYEVEDEEEECTWIQYFYGLSQEHPWL